MITTATTTATDGKRVRRIGVGGRRVAVLAVAVVAAGLTVWTGTRADVRTTDQVTDAAALTAGLSQELLADELVAIRGVRGSGAASTTVAVESGLSQELLADELAAIRRNTGAGSGLSQELLADELAAIRGE